MTIEQRNKILEEFCIPKSLWDECYISDSIVFTPTKNDKNETVKTGEENYNEWLAIKNNPKTLNISPEQKLKELEEKINTLNIELQQVIEMYGNMA